MPRVGPTVGAGFFATPEVLFIVVVVIDLFAKPVLSEEETGFFGALIFEILLKVEVVVRVVGTVRDVVTLTAEVVEVGGRVTSTLCLVAAVRAAGVSDLAAATVVGCGRAAVVRAVGFNNGAVEVALVVALVLVVLGRFAIDTELAFGRGPGFFVVGTAFEFVFNDDFDDRLAFGAEVVLVLVIDFDNFDSDIGASGIAAFVFSALISSGFDSDLETSVRFLLSFMLSKPFNIFLGSWASVSVEN